MSRALLLLLLLAACTPRPQHHKTAMESLPWSNDDGRQKIVLRQAGVFTLRADGFILCAADDATLINVYGGDGGVSIVGRKQGKTILHMKRRGDDDAVETADVDIYVVEPELDAFALAVGETITFPATNVKEFSASAPEIVSAVLPPDGGMFVITGKKPGLAMLVLLGVDGSQRSLKFEVVGGDKQI